MSGLLRRIKRSRDADADVPPPEGRPAESGSAPGPASGAEGVTHVMTAAPAPAGAHTDAPSTPSTLLPAGVDPAELRLRAPAGRRGRLRRRLRYLRRARELMLRDLGGLLFEVHRTGGGDVGAHQTLIAGKVSRLTAVDAEMRALEEALGAARPETVLFEPGVGGTCVACGELYGSGASFCSRCATPTNAIAVSEPAPGDRGAAASVPAMPAAPEGEHGRAETPGVEPPPADSPPEGANGRRNDADPALPPVEPLPTREHS
jgi:hypothetical protein